MVFMVVVTVTVPSIVLSTILEFHLNLALSKVNEISVT